MGKAFPVPRQVGTCADCGVQIVLEPPATNPDYRRLHLRLSDGSVSPVSFCPGCAEKPWTPERLAALERQMHLMWQLTSRTPEQYERNYTGLRVTELAEEYPVQTWAELGGLVVKL